jgi:hypothetical protein
MILLQLFRPYFERLIEVLIRKGQLPENDSTFTSEDKETFRCYRVDITDTMVRNRLIASPSSRLLWVLDVYAQCVGQSSD